MADRLPAKMEVMSSLLLLRDGLGTMEDEAVGPEETSAMEDVGEELEIFLGREKLGSEGPGRNCLLVQQCKKNLFHSPTNILILTLTGALLRNGSLLTTSDRPRSRTCG